jgi:hypothetical protein
MSVAKCTTRIARLQISKCELQIEHWQMNGTLQFAIPTSQFAMQSGQLAVHVEL